MVAPERTLLSTLRRDSLDMVDTQSVPKKSLMLEEKLFFGVLGSLRRRGRDCFREFDAPDVFFGFEAVDADVIGFGGANMADPDDTEASFAPEAAYFDGLAGRSQEADAVETRAILAEIDSVGALGKRMAFGVGTFDDDAESFWDAGLLAAFFPKIGDGLLEGQTDASFASGVGVEIDNADFLLLAAALVHEKNGVAQKEFGFQGDEGAAGIDDDGFGVFVESTGFASKTVYEDGYTHGEALSGAEYFLCGDGGEGNGKRWLVFL